MDYQTGVQNSSNKVNSPHNTMETIRYRFICHKQVAFGEAVYIVGNIQRLGEWDVSCAVRLDCYISDFWFTDIDVPIDTEIQYKYFVSSYEHHFSIKNLQIQENNWISSFQGNFRLFLGKRDQSNILQTKKTKNLKIMSFNLRYENSFDKDEFHWVNRRQNCLQLIKQHYPSILGVQQAKEGQRCYLQRSLCHLYNYVGVARDCKKDEQVGIFYDKQRFIVVEQGFRWISQSQEPGSVGFGASFPRYFTFLILEDTYISQKFEMSLLKQSKQQIPTWIPQNLIMVVNVHLDHLSQQAQKMGVQMISKQVQTKTILYKDQLKDVFVFGDFNTSSKNTIFKKFNETHPQLQSIRDYFEHKNERDFCDYGHTFNGFIEKNSDLQKPMCMIDHIFIHTSVYKPSEFQVIREMIHQSKNSKYTIVSDHFPIMGIFKPIIKEEF